MLERGKILIVSQASTSVLGIRSRKREGKNVVCILLKCSLKYEERRTDFDLYRWEDLSHSN